MSQDQMKVPQKRKLAFWQKMQREDGLSATLPLLSFSDRDSSGKPYLVQAYLLTEESAISWLQAGLDILYLIQNRAYCLNTLSIN